MNIHSHTFLNEVHYKITTNSETVRGLAQINIYILNYNLDKDIS